MLILDATTKKIQVVLGSSVTTNQLPVVTSWRDIVPASSFVPGSNIVNTNNTTDVDIVGAPGASTYRVVDFISVYNNDTTAKTVTVKFDVSGTDSIIVSVSLAAGERLQYQEGSGWTCYTNNGSIKQSFAAGSAAPISSGWNSTVLGSDVINNNAVANSIADITGLSFSVTSGNKYWFKFWIWWTSAASTTGARFSINGPSATGQIAYRSDYSLTATTRTFNEAIAYDIPAAANASPANIAGNIAIIDGYMQPTANGTVIGRFASEVASSAITAKAGSFVEYIQVA